MQKKRIIIIGASSLIAEHCARLWVEQEPVDLLLVGRDKKKMDRIAADLQIRSPKSSLLAMQADFLDPLLIEQQVHAMVAGKPLDLVLISHGFLPDQEKCQEDLSLMNTALMLNGVSPVLFAEAFAKWMQKANAGTLAVIGSVAGDRGRFSNYVYGSAKGLIEKYMQGLQHRFVGTGVKVILIKPGPTATPMTTSLKQKIKLAMVERVSLLIVQGIKKSQPIIYAPKKWRFIMWIIRGLPDVLFNKIRV